MPKFWNTVKQVLKWKFLVCNTFANKKEKLKTSAQLSTQESGKRSKEHTVVEQTLTGGLRNPSKKDPMAKDKREATVRQ